MKNKIFVFLLVLLLIAAPMAMAKKPTGPPGGGLDDVEDRLDDVEDDVDDLQEDVEDLEDGLDWNTAVNWHQKYRLDNLQSTIENNADSWSQDNVGGGGTSMSSVRKWAFGDFVDYLASIFAFRAEHDATEDKTYELEARLYFLEHQMDYDDTMVLFKAAQLEMADKNLTSVEHGEYTCSYVVDRFMCLRTVS